MNLNQINSDIQKLEAQAADLEVSVEASKADVDRHLVKGGNQLETSLNELTKKETLLQAVNRRLTGLFSTKAQTEQGNVEKAALKTLQGGLLNYSGACERTEAGAQTLETAMTVFAESLLAEQKKADLARAEAQQAAKQLLTLRGEVINDNTVNALLAENGNSMGLEYGMRLSGYNGPTPRWSQDLNGETIIARVKKAAESN